MTATSGVSSQVISLPQGGGAMQGIGESFSPDLFTGTGNFTVPLAVPAGRDGFQPELNLVYSTGSGNGPFGLGWDLSVSGVARKTSRGLPRYAEDQDTFVLAGEDLVAVEETAATIRYRPRTERLFARILHHHDATNDFWEVHSKSGSVSRYGTPQAAGRDPAVVAGPDDRSQVFAWKLTRTEDPFGNQIVYRYGRDLARDGLRRFDQLYLEEIGYVDYLDASQNPRSLVTVAFDYEDGSVAGPGRPDPFSHHRAGFEIRTRRRCQRIEIRTHADEAASPDAKGTLARRYELVYLDQRVAAGELSADLLPLNGVSLLSQIRVTGHDERQEAEADRVEAMPPLEFGYTAFDPRRQAFFPVGGELPASSLAHLDLELADLSGNGLPDIVQLNGVARYWANAGDGTFTRPRMMRQAPAGASLADPDVRLLDADGDGRIDLLVNRPGLSGYFPLSGDGEWDTRSFRGYRQAPSFPLADPNVALVDLDGDGVTDAVRAGTRFECFLQDPEQGWRELRPVPRRALEEFPNVDFADPRVQWADMTGDGLQDVVLVHHRSVEYWPTHGYGDWGPRVRMRASPELPGGYDPRRVLLGDVDGDGCADLVYVDDRRVLVWINQSGNGWSRPLEIPATPRVTTPEAVQLVDLLGSGIRGLLWSADATGPGRGQAFFLDFTGAVKPYLLDEMDNHMGAVTRVEYAPSTRFYLEDAARRQGRWRTPLPFPVQVVARVEAIDAISRAKLTTEYTYHHGYWDGAEREFRGFGRVDQRDTESFERSHAPGLHPHTAAAAVPAERFSPPLETRTWFHQGPIASESADSQESDFADEFWQGDPTVLGRPPEMVAFLDNLPPAAGRDALRTLRGRILRTELYALGGSARLDRPYTVTEHLHGAREEDPPGPQDGDRLRIFFPHSLAQRTTRWERGDDPMTRFSFTGDYDNFGQPRRQTDIACPRGWRSLTDTPASPYLATRTVTAYAAPADPQTYINDRIATVSTYEIRSDGGQQLADLAGLADDHGALAPIGHTLNYYDGEEFAGLALGQVGGHGALVRSEALVLTEDLLQQAYKTGDTVADPPEIPPYLEPGGTPGSSGEYPPEFLERLAPLAGYTFHAGEGDHQRGYYTTAARHRYDFHTAATSSPRGLLEVSRDPLDGDTSITYDRFGLLPTAVRDPVGLVTEARYDQRVLKPSQVTDANGNRTAVGYTPLGLVARTAVMGKVGEAAGDSAQAPGTRYEHALRAFEDSPPDARQPVAVRIVRRVHHVHDVHVPLPDRDETIETVEYSDGFGRLVQTRTQAEDVTFGDPAFGGGVLPADQTTPPGDVVGRRRPPGTPPTVLVSGATTYDNKGRAVEQFEPYFDRGFGFAAPTDDQHGRKITTVYDPRGRVVRTVHPDGSQHRVIVGVPGTIATPDLGNPDVFEPTPWEAYTYDANDLAPLSARNGGEPGATLGDHAPQAHHFTPTSAEIDALGRTIRAVERSGPDPATAWFTTRSSYDIRGNRLTVTDALGRETFRYAYDLADNPLRIDSIDAGLRRVVLDAAGSEIERRDSKGALVLQAYDRLQRPIRMWARDDATTTVTLRERLTYGDASDPAQDPTDRAANRAANRLGELHEHYDEAGRLVIDRYDFKANTVDKQRQVISDAAILTVFDGPSSDLATFGVDWQPPAGASLEAHAAALLDAFEYRTSAVYDALDRIATLRYPQDVNGDRKTLRARYNRAGALQQVTLDGAVYVDHIAYDAQGQRTFMALGNGVMTRYAYDPHTSRLARQHSQPFTSPGPNSLTYRPTGTVLQDFTYDYDLVGNITTIHNRTPGSGVPDTQLGTDALDRTFTYDPLYRLTSATGRECDLPPDRPPFDGRPRCADVTRARSYTQRFKYDPLGNMLALRHRANNGSFTRQLSHAPGTNQLATVTTGRSVFDYHYDPNGNLIRETTSRHFEWDHSDRLKAFRTQAEGAEPSLHAHYLYDSTGRRAKKLVRKQGGQHQTTNYIDGLFEHHRRQPEDAGDNNHAHIVDGQERIALVRTGPAHPGDLGPATQLHLGDHLGSSNVVIDHTGAFANREEYSAYGETAFGSFGKKRYRFMGKEREEESGCSYHGARYYACWLMRWTSCDPNGIASQTNVYEAFASNPFSHIDIDGREPKTPEKMERPKRGWWKRTIGWGRGKFGQIFVRVGLATGDVDLERADPPVIENPQEKPKADVESNRQKPQKQPPASGRPPEPDPATRPDPPRRGGEAPRPQKKPEALVSLRASPAQKPSRARRVARAAGGVVKGAAKFVGRIFAPIAAVMFVAGIARAAQAAARGDWWGAARAVVDATFVGDVLDAAGWARDRFVAAWDFVAGRTHSIAAAVREGMGEVFDETPDVGIRKTFPSVDLPGLEGLGEDPDQAVDGADGPALQIPGTTGGERESIGIRVRF